MDKIFEIDSRQLFDNVIVEVLENLYDPKHVFKDVDNHIILDAKEDLQKIIYSSNYDFAEVEKSLSRRSWHEDRKQSFLSAMDTRKTQLLYSTLMYHQSTHGETVTDFDWLVKFVYGTNDLKTLKYPLLQLILTTICSTGESKHIVYDVNKEVLAKLIKVLEDIDDDI